MKRVIALALCVLLFSLSACYTVTIQPAPPAPTAGSSLPTDSAETETVAPLPGVTFRTSDDGRSIFAPDGTEYVFLANEGFVCTFGTLSFLGQVEGEASVSLGFALETGIFSCENDPEQRTLVRMFPDSEWLAYYRKASLPPLDLLPDNCIRMELVSGLCPGSEHILCNDGIVGTNAVKAFLADIRSQKTAREANLYALCERPDGFLENCYELGIVYGYFQDEPNLAIPMHVTSYNDKAYSICWGNGADYVLPEAWLAELSKSNP